MRIDRVFHLETVAGKPVEAGPVRLVPLARSVRLHVPGRLVGLSWSRPTAVVVRATDGSEQLLAIRDVTRQAQVILLAIGLVGALFTWLLWREE